MHRRTFINSILKIRTFISINDKIDTPVSLSLSSFPESYQEYRTSLNISIIKIVLVFSNATLSPCRY